MEIITSYTDRNRRTFVVTRLQELSYSSRSMTLVELEKAIPRLKGRGVLLVEYNKQQHSRLVALSKALINMRSEKHYWSVVIDVSGIKSESTLDLATSVHQDATLDSLVSKKCIHNIVIEAETNAKSLCKFATQFDQASESQLAKAVVALQGDTTGPLHHLKSRSPKHYLKAIALLCHQGRADHVASHHLFSLLNHMKTQHNLMVSIIQVLLSRGNYKKECFKVQFQMATANENKEAAIKKLAEMQSVQSENSRIFTKLAITALESRDKTALTKAVSRYIIHTDPSNPKDFIFSLLLVVMEADSGYTWGRKIVHEIITNYNRRINIAIKAQYQACIVMIDAIALLKNHKPICAALRFQKLTNDNRGLLSQRAGNDALWVLSLVYCSLAGEVSRLKAELSAGLPNGVNPRVKSLLRFQVQGLREDLKFVNQAIVSKEQALKAFNISKRHPISVEILAEISSNLDSELAQTEEYLKLLSAVAKVERNTNKFAKALQIERDQSKNYFITEASHQLHPIREEYAVSPSWLGRTLTAMRSRQPKELDV